MATKYGKIAANDWPKRDVQGCSGLHPFPIG